MKLTKTEQAILAEVRGANCRGALMGLGIHPEDADFGVGKSRFVKRMYEAGVLAYVKWTPRHGSGWALPEYVSKFQE